MTESRLFSPRRMSIYLRLSLPFALAIVIIAALAWWTATSLLTATLEQRLDDQLGHATDVLANGTFPLTTDILRRVADLQDADFALVREDGTVGLSSMQDTRPELVDMIERARRGERAPLLESHALVFRDLPRGRNLEYVSIAGVASLRDIHAAGRRTAWRVGGLALAAALLMAIVGHGISSNIASRVRDLSLMAGRIAAGDRDVRADLAVPAEMRELTVALNEMTSRLREYELEMIKTNRLANLGEIATRVAHEIRNPLTAMKLHAQMLEERSRGTPEEEIAAQLVAEMNRLDLVVASTLAFGRPTKLDMKPGDVNAIVGEVVSLVAPQFEHRHIVLEVTTDPVDPQPLDAVRLKQVIFNLLTNAADELSEGGTVRIATSKTETGVSVTVEDSGSGLDERVGEGIFDGTVSDKPLGLGIGLVIAKELVELHGGSIAADTSTLGGARFVVELPAQQPG